MSEKAAWDDVRAVKVDLAIIQAGRVHETYPKIQAATAEVNRLHLELGKAIAAKEAAIAERDEWTAKVAKTISEYQHIGEGSE